MILISKATAKDIPFIVEIWEEFMQEHDEILVKENPKLESYLTKNKDAPKNYKKFVQKHIKSKNGVVYMAEVDGTTVGYTLMFVKDEIPIFKIKKIGFGSDLYVKKGFRGMNVSSKLSAQSIKWLKKKGIKCVSLTLYNDNKLAHSIYKKWGFFDYKIEMRKLIK